jgi:hypothetical protein
MGSEEGPCEAVLDTGPGAGELGLDVVGTYELVPFNTWIAGFECNVYIYINTYYETRRHIF